MAAFRSALLAFLAVQQANAFTSPSITTTGHATTSGGSARASKNGKQSKVVSHSFLGGFDVATLEVEQVQLLEVAGAAIASAAALVAGSFALKGNKQQSKSIAKTKEAVAAEAEPEPVDISIPYHAAAAIAFDAWLKEDTSRVYDEATYLKFEALYEDMAVAEVIKKKYQQQVDKYQEEIDQYLTEMASLVPVAPTTTSSTADVSIPYDAAAKLAFEASDKSMPYEDFKVKYEEDAVALVKSKQT